MRMRSEIEWNEESAVKNMVWRRVAITKKFTGGGVWRLIDGKVGNTSKKGAWQDRGLKS